MTQFAPVTDSDLARARQDPQFRQQLLAGNLDMLLAALHKLRAQPTPAARHPAAEQDRQIREAVDLAVKLSERLHALAGPEPGGRPARR